MQTTLNVVSKSDKVSLDTVLELVKAPIYTDTWVEAHKAAEIAKAPAHWLWKWRPVIAGVLNVAVAIAAGACAIGAIALVSGALILVVGGPSFVFTYGLLALVSGAVVIYGAHRITLIKVRPTAHWEVCGYQHDDKTPDRARALVREIEVLLEYSVFTLHKLKQDDKELDPILEVTAHNPKTGELESRVILVWDQDGNIILPSA